MLVMDQNIYANNSSSGSNSPIFSTLSAAGFPKVTVFYTANFMMV